MAMATRSGLQARVYAVLDADRRRAEPRARLAVTSLAVVAIGVVAVVRLVPGPVAAAALDDPRATTGSAAYVESSSSVGLTSSSSGVASGSPDGARPSTGPTTSP